MKKILIISIAIISILVFSACSNKKESNKYNSDNIKDTPSNTKSQQIDSSINQTNSKNDIEQNKSMPSIFSGYSDEQIEYARVVEALIHHYKVTYQPEFINATVNGKKHSVFPFKGSVVIPQDTITLSFSSDNTMASTIVVTYSSNHNGSISFYRDPNHYQDDRYLYDPVWVHEESKRLSDTMQMLEIPSLYDDQALKIISKIRIN